MSSLEAVQWKSGNPITCTTSWIKGAFIKGLDLRGPQGLAIKGRGHPARVHTEPAGRSLHC
eukprot:644597-Pelagomonas_calceolata.AAC.5